MTDSLNALLDFLQENKAKDISLFNIKNASQDEQYIVLANFSTALENKAFAEKIVKLAGLEDYPEGYNKGEWIIFCLDDVLLHTFVPQKREKYNLDKLYQSFKVNLKQDKKGRGKA